MTPLGTFLQEFQQNGSQHEGLRSLNLYFEKLHGGSASQATTLNNTPWCFFFREFGKMAVSMLRLSYQESSMYTFSALSKPLEDFSNRTVVELAKLGGNKYFIAHPCCQKWLTQRWFGNIHIRELDWGGSFKLPDGLKVRVARPCL